jgi:hypothetical protein
MPKFDSHPFDPAPEVSNPALNGSADRLTAVPSPKPHEIRQVSARTPLLEPPSLEERVQVALEPNASYSLFRAHR